MGKEKCPKCNAKNEVGFKFCSNCAYKNDDMASRKSTCSYNFVVMGMGGVGKSAITIRFINQQFQAKYDPTIEDRYQKVIDYQGVPCFLEILDTAGQETFAAMRELYMRNGEGFALVYSVTDPRSLMELGSLRSGIIKNQIEETQSLSIIIVGNKADLEEKRQISREAAEQQAKEWGHPFIECSAKNGTNITEIFQSLIQMKWDLTGGSPPMRKTRGGCTVF
eukprot:TRINITY_DN1753_c0_g1_i19.p1 TRINITY_DN1753_c0_g1~~TRINITY_DN1753_c0_g1_i19.p1  ORF type:complete len:222 (-),score=37.11 TRINITY_DN1753_c0_g1_i19:235-900(-)